MEPNSEISSVEWIGLNDTIKKTLSQGLSQIMVAELAENAWSLSVLKKVALEEGRLKVDIELPSFGLASEKQVAYGIKKILLSIEPDPSKVELNVYSHVKPAVSQSILIEDIADVRNIILVASGKGGVGKSTVSCQLAGALAALGCRVGLLDADVYGPSVPTMFGIPADVEIQGFKDEKTNATYMIPPRKFGVSLMSIGFLVDAASPMVWRGPMIAQASMQMFQNVAWGQLDYLIVDLPPGTGDIQLTISQRLKIAGALIVSTPQDVALADVIRAKNMFDKVQIDVLGLVENMSYFQCDGCDKRHEIFGSLGAQKKAEELHIPFLKALPLTVDVRSYADQGRLFSKEKPDGPEAQGFFEIGHALVATLAKKAFRNPPTEKPVQDAPNPKPLGKKNRLPMI